MTEQRESLKSAIEEIDRVLLGNKDLEVNEVYLNNAKRYIKKFLADENPDPESKEDKIAKAVAATGLSEQQIRQMISNGKIPMGPWLALQEED